MSDRHRTVFFVSDGTGITAEMLGHSLLTQFGGIQFTQVVLPFVDSADKARECARRIAAARAQSGTRPLVFCTLIDDQVRRILRGTDALVLDFFDSFLGLLQSEFETVPSRTVGRSHGAASDAEYLERIEAVNFALAHDDGLNPRDLREADVILVGVSRSGKTPTCLYMALQFGVKAANCPLTPDDFERAALPSTIEALKAKLYGLTIAPARLAAIRHERRPDSRYASIENCRYEVQQAETLMRRHGIPWLDSTTLSIEEIATKIMQDARVERRAF